MKEVTVLGVENDELKINLSGDIDVGNADEFFATVETAYAAAKKTVAFDCTQLAFIDSTTLGTFVKILKAVKSDGFEMSLVGLQPKIKKLFVICSLDTIMEIA